MTMPRVFVLYVGDNPSTLSLIALTRAGARAKPTQIDVRVGRPALVELKQLNGLNPDEGPATEYAITPKAAGITGIVAQSFGPDGPLGQVEAYLEIRPADGHTVALELGAPDERLAPPPPPQREAELSVASSHPISEKNRDGDGSGSGSAEAENKAALLRTKVCRNLGLPADATDADIEHALERSQIEQEEAAAAAAKKNSTGGVGSDAPNPPQTQG